MAIPMTALERDLLICVEQLVTVCETSAKELSGLEERSTGKIGKQLTGLTDCVDLLICSQVASMKALRGLLSEEASYKELDNQLQKSLHLTKTAEEKLKQS